MGFVSALLGDANPLSKFVADNRNTLHGAFAGFGQGTDLGSGFANAAVGAQRGNAADDAWAQAQAAEDKRLAQINSTAAFLRAKGQEDLASAVEGGFTTGNDAFNQWYTGAHPKAAEAFTLGAGDTRYGADGSVIAQGAPDQQDQFGNETSLAKEYAGTDPLKVYETVKGGYQRVYEGAQLDNGAGDMAVIYGFMKMNDPGSVVRESEFQMAAQSGSLGEQIQGAVNQVLTGGRLQPDVRDRMVEAAAKLYDQTANDVNAVNDQYTQRANTYGVDPTHVIRQPETFAPLSQRGAVWQAPNGNTVRAIP